MAQPAPAKSTSYQQLIDLPENLTGEIINGELHVQPRPAGPHTVAQSSLEIDIGSAYHRGLGGPGGWWILMEPEIHFVRDTEVLVPDLVGWRRTRMPEIPQDQRFEITPDWVCEILSPSTMQKDRVIKMPVYARHGVPHLWLVDPLAHTLEVFLLQNDRWSVIGRFKETDLVRVAPFEALELALGDLWLKQDLANSADLT